MSKSEKNLTPLMKQYWEVKSVHQDKILLFRMGDFFEMFHDDALTAAPLLGIALTQRNKKSQDETPMCGVPHHSIGGHINRLLQLGHKVAICDQIEDPKLAKGLVKRAVTRILTPGMVYDNETLAPMKSHYMASLDSQTLCFLETSTGEAFYYKLQDLEQSRILLERIPCAEIVYNPQENTIFDFLQIYQKNCVLSSFDGQFSSSSDRLCAYLKSLSHQEWLNLVKSFEERTLEQFLDIPSVAFRHLEIFENSLGEEKGTLFQAINRTKTSSGARRLRYWMTFPLRDLRRIELRQNQIEFFRSNVSELKNLQKKLSGLGDMQRKLSKISTPQVGARDLLALGQDLENALQVVELVGVALSNQKTGGSSIPVPALQNIFELSQEIKRTLCENPPLSLRQGHIISNGFSAELDELITLSTQSQTLLQEMEQREKLSTGIGSLKIRYNNVFGYYIEVTHVHSDKIPSRYKRKQTLANAERFYTDELIELERKVLSAQARRFDLEYEIFESLRKNVLSRSTDILMLADYCSEVDVLSSLAWLSLERNYCRPQIAKENSVLLVSSRHPVVEQSVGPDFRANDVNIDHGQAILITGPNMAGKSTILRQVALIALMAQMGSFVPASSCHLPLFDAIYTRIGASDALSEGLSTFMVEMTEASQILKKATSKSLVILDEVGRGTSTYDGLSLAQALLEHLVSVTKSFTLFATHYHELTQLESEGWKVKNAHMSVSENKGEVRFLHSLKPGPALKSYGIHVGQLAGLPVSVLKRAQVLLKGLESKLGQIQASPQMSLMDIDSEWNFKEAQKESEIEKKIKGLNINSLTPIQALMVLEELSLMLNHSSSSPNQAVPGALIGPDETRTLARR